MAAANAIERPVADSGRSRVKHLIAAEDAARALFQLQRRIQSLERENQFLRDCIPAAAKATPHSLAL